MQFKRRPTIICIYSVVLSGGEVNVTLISFSSAGLDLSILMSCINEGSNLTGGDVNIYPECVLKHMGK